MLWPPPGNPALAALWDLVLWLPAPPDTRRGGAESGRCARNVYLKTGFVDISAALRLHRVRFFCYFCLLTDTHEHYLYGTGKETYRIYQRLDRRGMAAASLHPCGRMCQDSAGSLPSLGASVGETGEFHDRQDHCAGGEVPLGGAVLPQGMKQRGRLGGHFAW